MVTLLLCVDRRRSHETAEPTRCFVRIDSMSYAVDIHWLTRNSLCELRLKDGTREVSAVMDYESGK
jgi:hypothetical protein